MLSKIILWWNFEIIIFNGKNHEKTEFQNSNVGGKQIENLCQCRFWNKFDFSTTSNDNFNCCLVENPDSGIFIDSMINFNSTFFASLSYFTTSWLIANAATIPSVSPITYNFEMVDLYGNRFVGEFWFKFHQKNFIFTILSVKNYMSSKMLSKISRNNMISTKLITKSWFRRECLVVSWSVSFAHG